MFPVDLQGLAVLASRAVYDAGIVFAQNCHREGLVSLDAVEFGNYWRDFPQGLFSRWLFLD